MKSKRFKKFKGQILREGHDLSIIAGRVQVSRALEAAEMLSIKHKCKSRYMSTIKPIDKDLVVDCSKDWCVTRRSSIYGGLGSVVSEVVSLNYLVALSMSQDTFRIWRTR